MAVSTSSLILSDSVEGFECPRSTYLCPCIRRESQANVKQGVVAENSVWLVLQTPSIPAEEISILRQKVKYLAVLPNMEGAVVLIDDGRGLLQPQSAFYVAENVIFVFDGPVPQSSKYVRMVLYRNPVWNFTCSGKGITFSTIDLASFLFVGENLVLQKILQYDECYAVIDRFMLAMAFIYLKRANMSDYVFTNIVAILAALLLANKMEEDEGAGRTLLQLIYSSLPQKASTTEKLKFVGAVINFQATLFQKILYRGYVSVEECEEIISVSPQHPFWKRWRLSFHGGAVRRNHQSWKLQLVHNSCTAICPNVVLNPMRVANKCIMCHGNSNYCSSVQERFCVYQPFDAQSVHLTNILLAVTEVHQLNLKLAMVCSEFTRNFQQWSMDSAVREFDSKWPLEYCHLLDVEKEIENVLADEHYLQSLVSMMQKKKLMSDKLR